MKKSGIVELCLLIVVSVAPISVNAQSIGKEEYMVIDTGYSRDNAEDLQESLNKYAKQGWKVRAANEYLNDNHTLSMFVILYRESQ
jgi:hypothetical protein